MANRFIDPDLARQMRNWDAHAGDRIDPVATALRRLFLRVELCPCGGMDEPPRRDEPCRQCQLDLESIEAAWLLTEK